MDTSGKEEEYYVIRQRHKQNLEHVEIELVIRKLHPPTKKIPKPHGFNGEFNQIFKELTVIPHQLFQKQRKMDNFTTHSMKPILS